ncbi:MAG: YihY family inner membrane protein [Proteobacteria bacterium]|nr:YihY family inner membrane protein [Pseudomonadota bacterium]
MLKLLQEKFNQLLWGADLKTLAAYQAFIIRALRIFYGAIRDLNGGLPSLRAMGLVYTTLISLVPLLAVSFSVLKGFGAHNQLKPALLSLMEPLGEKGIELSDKIISFVDQVNVGVLGAIGLVVLIYSVLTLVKKIESAFNYTWRISDSRSIVQRFSNYLSVILLGPLLLFAAAGITASFNSSAVVDKISSIEPFGTILLYIGELTPFVLTIMSFTFMYMLIPNTKVKFRSAFYGATIATILWKIAGSIFTGFIVDSTNYTAIYSGFAVLIIFMIWIYVNWLIVLSGASISYYHQHPDRISDQSQIIRLSSRLREKLALTIMQLVATSFHNKQTPWSVKLLAKKIQISEQAIQLIIKALLSNDLLNSTGKNAQFFLPGQSLENISLHMILSAARSAEETPLLRPDDVKTVAQVNEAIETVETAIENSAKGISLKDLI